jgi:histidine triad (HIT) family protein
MSDCLFCKIVKKEIPGKLVYEDDDMVAFNDINPKAPIHILLIPKKHIEKLSDLKAADSKLVSRLILNVSRIAESAGIKENGFRVVINDGKNSGQQVYHLHLHILGGKPMSWNPA